MVLEELSSSAQLGPLSRSDGSASYSRNGCSVLASVNGPMEIQRRDEIPEEGVVSVHLRPAAGVGGIRERHLESLLERTLRQLIQTTAFPRSLVQITLQVASFPARQDTDGGSRRTVHAPLPQAAAAIDLLPTCFQASMLALLSTSVPLRTTAAAVLVAVSSSSSSSSSTSESDGNEVEVTVGPTPEQQGKLRAMHVLAYTAQGDLLLWESEGGACDVRTLEEVCRRAKNACLGGTTVDEQQSDEMQLDHVAGLEGGLLGELRSVVVQHVAGKVS